MNSKIRSFEVTYEGIFFTPRFDLLCDHANAKLIEALYTNINPRFPVNLKDIQVTGAVAKCNEIATEAVASNLDELLSPSAAKTQGTCLPVFQRRALSKLEYQRFEKFTIDPASGVLATAPA